MAELVIGELRKTFGNYTRSLEILYLTNNIKKAVRLDANENELEKIRDFCSKEKLCLEISDFKVIKIKDEGKGNYSNIAKRASNEHIGDGLYHVYISKDKTISKFLKLLENKNDDEAVGKILGYPKCCIDFFMKNREKQQKLQNDYILPALENSEGFEFPFYTNYAARYFDVTLLSHFPHSFHCGESIKIAKNNFELIKKHSKELADKFGDILKSAVLYTDNSGIFILRDYKFEGSALQFNEIKSTINNELSNLLNKNKRMEIINKNMIKIDDKIVENAGFMLFS